MASIFHGTYPGPGITLGPALVFGYLAAMHAAGIHGAGRPPASSLTSLGGNDERKNRSN